MWQTATEPPREPSGRPVPMLFETRAMPYGFRPAGDTLLTDANDGR